MPNYNNSALEQFKPEKLPVGWPWRLLVLSLVTLTMVILSYFGLLYGYQPYLKNQIQETEAKSAKLSSEISATDKDQFIKSYSQLANLQGILKNHIFGSQFFPFLEKLTNQKNYFLNANIKFDERNIILNGIAQSYSALGEQLAAFDSNPLIENYILNQTQTTTDNLVQYKLTFKVSPKVLLLNGNTNNN